MTYQCEWCGDDVASADIVIATVPAPLAGLEDIEICPACTLRAITSLYPTPLQED